MDIEPLRPLPPGKVEFLANELVTTAQAVDPVCRGEILSLRELPVPVAAEARCITRGAIRAQRAHLRREAQLRARAAVAETLFEQSYFLLPGHHKRMVRHVAAAAVDAYRESIEGTTGDLLPEQIAETERGGEVVMRIIKAIEPIEVSHPVFLIFAQPGWGKTSLGYSLADPLLLDFDKGAHRAANRRDTLVIDTWPDVTDLMTSGDVLDPYSSLTVDTVGRCLDVMTAHIAQTEPKKAPGGNLSLQGWGTLKANFRTWIAQVRAKGKDVLLVAHDKEDKDGDNRIIRPDIAGASYSEVMKVADFVGYGYIAGRRRILDFNPTDKWIGKNPAGWEPFELPPVAKCQDFMAALFDKGRAALGDISEASAQVVRQVQAWREKILGFTTAAQYNAAMPEIKALPPILAPQVSKMLIDCAPSAGFEFDKAKKQFFEKAKKAEPEKAAATA